LFYYIIQDDNNFLKNSKLKIDLTGSYQLEYVVKIEFREKHARGRGDRISSQILHFIKG
jgi:hypothetical protein